MASVTVDLKEWNELTSRVERAEAEALAAKLEFTSATVERLNAFSKDLLVAFRASLDVSKYAMGMLSPEIARKWPKDALLAVAAGIKLMPDADAFELETVSVIESFARDIDHWDASRNEGYRPPPGRPAIDLDAPVPPTMVSRATGFLPENPGQG